MVRLGYVSAKNYEEGGEGEYKRGFGYEYFQKISYITGWKYEYVYCSFAECFDKLVKGEIDLFGNVSIKPERKKQILFSKYPMGKDTYWLYAANHREDLISKKLENLQGAKIAVTRGSFQYGLLKDWLREQQFRVEIVECDGFNDMMSRMNEGTVDAMVAPDLSVEYGYKIITGVGFSDYYFGVSKKRPDILAQLNDALYEIQNAETDYNSLLAAKYYYKTAGGTIMNDEEKRWLAAHHNTIRLGCLSNYLPFIGVINGKVVGVFTTVAESLKEDYGVNVELLTYPDQRALEVALENGEIDLYGPVVGDFYLAEQENQVLTESIVKTTPVIIYRGDDYNKSIKLIAAANESVFNPLILKTNFPNSKLLVYETIEASIQAVANGEAGSMVIPSARINFMRSNPLMKNMTVAEVANKSIDIKMITTKENRRVVTIVNKAILHSSTALNGMVLAENSNANKKVSAAELLKEHAGIGLSVLAGIVFILLLLSVRLLKNRKKLAKALLIANEANAAADVLNKQLKTQLEVINSVGKVFYTLYYIDMRDFSYISVGEVPEPVLEVIGDKGDAKVAFERMLEFLIAKEFADEVREFVNLDTLNQRIKNQPWISSVFLGTAVGWAEGMFIAADRDEKGNCKHVIWGIRSIQEQKEKELENERLLELRVQTMSDAIHGGFKIGKNDSKFTFIKVSEQLAQLLGYDTPEELMEASGGCMANIVNHEDTVREMPKAFKAVSNGEIYTMHYRVRCKNGAWKNVEDRGRLIVNEKGEEEFWSFIVDQDLLTKLEIANEAKTNFLFNMSHDIRTPMNAILGYSQLVKKELTDPKLLDYHEKIEHSGNLLLSIINNVLDMARIESGKVEIDETYVNTDNVKSELMSVFEESAKKKNITLTSKWISVHRHLMADQTKVKEIFLNLVSNAIKYTPDGGTVKITSTELPCEKEGYVRIRTEIEDNGIGMSKEYLPHLFDAFTRERNSTTSKILGTGLGMPIVKKLVDLMGGSIEVESELGKGTKFTLYLEHRIADKIYYEQKNQVSESRKKEVMEGKRILLAEDNELNAEIATVILEERGFYVERVCDGIQCVAAMEREPAGTYDVILMDVQMPGMDGYKATQTIRQLNDVKKASIPIVAMTANAFEEDRKNAFAVGMNGHIAKPINVEKVESVLLSVLKSEN